MSTILIGIAGGTGSGKTTLTRHLKEHFGPEVTVIGHDNYYKRQDGKTLEERAKVNYDHPAAFDTELLIEHLKELKEGRPIRSGHIGINSWRRASSSTQSCGLDAPSYRQGRPSRHAEIRIFILSPPHNPVFPLKLPVKPSRRPASVVRRQHRLQAHDPGLTQRRQQAVQFPLQTAEYQHLPSDGHTTLSASLSLG